ncbi:MAG: DUF1549 domain-containing protein [Acidobacteriia bacterium]|nr:DUF1549 domain-containing protein [Terriglobia bacterium]
MQRLLAVLFASAVLAAGAHPLDHLLEVYAGQNKVGLPAPVDDALFARRAYLDLWGLLPTPEQLAAFERDSTPKNGKDKRARLVDQLLGNRKNFASHWISFWNDHLRNDEGVVYHGDRKSITGWLLPALESNLPYDRFLQALLNPISKSDPDGFLIGVNWRGDISASQTPVMQAAQNSAQVFLGVNLKCNSCHDSFISKWKLRDAYGLAAFFSDGLPEVHRCEVSMGVKAQPRFLFPTAVPVSPDASLPEKRAAVARLFTAPENTRMPRTYINRIWKALLGRGFVEPADTMDGKPWSKEMLDWLADDFAAHGYDTDHLLRTLMSSRAYQLPAVARAPDKEFVFRGPVSRRLTGEQFLDAVSSVTGEWRLLEPAKPGPARYARDWQLKSSPLGRTMGRPIRDQVVTERIHQPTTLGALELVNGETLSSLLVRGAQRMTGTLAPAPGSLYDSGVVTSGKANFEVDVTGASRIWLLLENVDSYDPARVKAGWGNPRFAGPGSSLALAPSSSELHFKGDPSPVPAVLAGVPSLLIYDIPPRGFTRFVGVAGADQSSLQSDINPRLRFFIFTDEPDASRLYAVEGEPPAPPPPASSDRSAMIARLYRHALGRGPTPEELRLARGFYWEDLLWAVFLSPEFQYIR